MSAANALQFNKCIFVQPMRSYFLQSILDSQSADATLSMSSKHTAHMSLSSHVYLVSLILNSTLWPSAVSVKWNIFWSAYFSSLSFLQNNRFVDYSVNRVGKSYLHIHLILDYWRWLHHSCKIELIIFIVGYVPIVSLGKVIPWTVIILSNPLMPDILVGNLFLV